MLRAQIVKRYKLISGRPGTRRCGFIVWVNTHALVPCHALGSLLGVRVGCGGGGPPSGWDRQGTNVSAWSGAPGCSPFGRSASLPTPLQIATATASAVLQSPGFDRFELRLAEPRGN